MNDVFKYKANDLRNHPQANYYVKIKTYLEKLAPSLNNSIIESDNSQSVLFCNFFLDLFIEVHGKMELENDERRIRNKEFEKQDRRLERINKDEVNRLLKRIDIDGEAIVSKIQLEAIIQSRVSTREDRVKSVINTQNHVIERLLSDPMGRHKAAREGSPLKLTDLRGLAKKDKPK